MPKRSEKVLRIPLYPSYAFADAIKRIWITKSKSKSIRKETDRPGSNTSCDHLISHEPGTIAQVIRRLT